MSKQEFDLETDICDPGRPGFVIPGRLKVPNVSNLEIPFVIFQKTESRGFERWINA